MINTSLRMRVKELAEGITRVRYRAFLGEPAHNGYSELLGDFRDLLCDEVIQAISREESENAEERRIIFSLRGYLIGQWLSYKTSHLMDRLTMLQTEPAFSLNGRSYSLRQMQAIAEQVRHGDIRSELTMRISDYINTKINPVVFEYYSLIDTETRLLGYEGFLDAANNIRGYDIDHLVTTAERVIDKSDLLFSKEIEPRMHQGHYVTQDFSSVLSSQSAEQDMRSLAYFMDWELQSIQVNPSKTTRGVAGSFCVPLDIPGEIILVLPAGSGFNQHRLTYHEFGHGFHFGNTDQCLPYEYRRMGDNAVPEAFAALFESLLYNPDWLSHHGYVQDIEYDARRHRLYMVRKYWSKLAAEQQIHGEKIYSQAGRHVVEKCYKRGLNGRINSSFWALQLDDDLNAAYQLRAWLLSGQIKQRLEELHGGSWFLDQRAGKWLKELFSTGYKYSADEISSLLGFSSLNCDALECELKL